MAYTISASHVDGGVVTENGGKKETWKQWLMTFIATLPFFTSSLQHTYITSIRSESPPYWASSSALLGAAASAVLFSWLVDCGGRRAQAGAAAAVQILSWTPLLYDLNQTTIITSSALIGIALGGIYTSTLIYILEISEQKTKGIAVTSSIVMASLGHLVMKMMLLVNQVVILYLVSGLVVGQLVVMMIMVESPSYFVVKGDIQKAAISLGNLNRLPPEDKYVESRIAELVKESDRAKAKGNLNIISIVRNRIFRAGIKIGIALQTLTVLSGRLVFLDHTKVLDQSGVYVGDVWSIATPSVMVCGAVVTVTLVDLVERKYLLSTSYAITTISLGILAVFMQADMQATNLPWVPKTCLLLVVFGYAVGLGVSLVVMCEVLNFEIRTRIVALVVTYGKILDIIHLQTFQYIEAWAGIHCLFYIFATINLFGMVYTLFAVPDCTNKSVRQIEKQFKKVPII